MTTWNKLTFEEECELINLWHLSRTALARPVFTYNPDGTHKDYIGPPTTHERAVWAAGEFAKLHPEVSTTGAYKALDRLRYPGPIE